MILNGRSIRFLMWIFLASCTPATLADLRAEGESETKKLAAELREIESKDELQKAVPRLRKRFLKLADLLVEARGFPLEEGPPTPASEELFIELARLYEMPGGRELIEWAEGEAVARLERSNSFR